MSAATDLAQLSSIGTQLDELAARITTLAERYGTTPDSAVASELFAVERQLGQARRAVERAVTLLEESAK
jgi:hypothetical protein